jgi:hypothetical protein
MPTKLYKIDGKIKEYRRCKPCGEVLPISAFGSLKSNPKYICKECDSLRVIVKRTKQAAKTFSSATLKLKIKRNEAKLKIMKAELERRNQR